MFVVIMFIVIASALLSWAWVKGISNMKKNDPDYKGDDFIHTASGRDLWDDYDEDAAHYEGDF